MDASSAKFIKVGVPSIVMQAIGSVMNIGMNKILMSFTAVAVNVFGIYFKLQSFIFMPVFGLTNGMIPIVGYNFGARKPKRIKGTIRYAILLRWPSWRWACCCSSCSQMYFADV